MISYRKSRWRYNTGASVAGALGPLSAARGILVLDDPAKVTHHFNFSTFGINLLSLRIPKQFQLPELPLPKGRGLTGSGSTTDFWGDGVVLMNYSFQGDELSAADFGGGAFIAEMGGGMLIAKAYTIMHMGIPEALMLACAASPALIGMAARNARAMIVMKGISEGLIDGLGLSSSIGFVSHG
ncbi:hypothetical protein [Caballeronia sp. LZ034LL]|uniref:hypothetical protein n=1 Tax=Caballeronia sp. LZ034LL TaxID=3038567 RepID=UPI00285A7635|nr:hypothetical protein [Caballeronia sp. LZ034LL]MDR5838846.1 hypothetical protein [Caballeronia sp. LZ034LL]